MIDKQRLEAIRRQNERAEYVHSGRWDENAIDVQGDIDELLEYIDQLHQQLRKLQIRLALEE